jgi:hypothetical protein
MGVPSESVVFIAQFLSSKNKQNKEQKFTVYKSLILGKWGEGVEYDEQKETLTVSSRFLCSVYPDSRRLIRETES